MKKPINIGIIGASGYMGLELVRLLSRHPQANISLITSEKYKGLAAAEIFPSLKGICPLHFEALAVEQIIHNCDLVFTALPHQEAMKIIPPLLKEGKKVIDLSADYRLKDPAVYAKWYHTEHTSPDLLSGAVYGLPEINRERIKSSNLVANPGCYPTSILLGLAPLLKNGVIPLGQIIIDSKSGVSGAGRSSEISFNYNECNENIRAYNVNKHRHTPEIEQELSGIAGRPIRISFTPHLIPLTRGILSTIYVQLKEKDFSAIKKMYRDFYQTEKYVRVSEEKSPEVHNVKGSNYCDLGLFFQEEFKQLTIISCIDNLVKGGSGQAVQNMNLLYGWPEETALTHLPLYL